MFRRSKTESAETTDAVTLDKHEGKGRPTPTRREAEAAARARAKVPRTRKEQLKAQRQSRSESSRTIREGMKNGDERYMLARDKGPVRKFVRDFVDSRFGVAEIAIPLMVIALVVPNLVLILFPVLIIDLLVLRWRISRQLTLRFPGESHRGTGWYAITRAMQMKFMRLPKSKIKIGQQLPEHYR